jgi:hypothetical protein
VEQSVAIPGARRAGAGCGGYEDGGDLAVIDITQRDPHNDAPKKASGGTRPVAIGACAAT